MTLLNTISNLGSHWPQTLALYLVDYFTVKQCFKQSTKYLNSTSVYAIGSNQCKSELDSQVKLIFIMTKIKVKIVNKIF